MFCALSLGCTTFERRDAAPRLVWQPTSVPFLCLDDGDSLSSTNFLSYYLSVNL